MTALTTPHARRRRQEGQALVEFALVLPFLLMIVLGIIQFGVLFHNYLTLTDAVRAGARQAAVSRTDPDPEGRAEARVRQSADKLKQSSLAVTVRPFDPVSGTETWKQGGDVTVSARYPYSINILGITVLSGTLESNTTERVE
jgi:Flp pilus assembly protein TadG